MDKNPCDRWKLSKERIDAIKKELEGYDGVFPTNECLQPHELSRLSGDTEILEITGEQLLDRIHHVLDCEFCLPLVRMALGITKKKPSE